MLESIYNHNDIYQLLYSGNTAQAQKCFLEKTKPEDFTPSMRTAYLSSLNYGIYNFILIHDNVSLHECCAENESLIILTTQETFLRTGSTIIHSYGYDSRYLIEKYHNPHIKAALTYIHQHLSEPLSLKTVGEAINLNASYLSDIFRREVGTNFSDYILSHRIGTAKLLLKNQGIPVQAVAEQCGFNSVGYFSTSFKKMTGQSPSEYRRMSSHSDLFGK